MDAINTLANLAIQVFAAFVQLIVYILSFFLTLASMVLTALHLQ